MTEIPKSQRYVNRPALEEISSEGIITNKEKRDKRIVEAVEKYGYRQNDIAQHLRMHYSTISNLIRRTGKV